MRRFALRRWTCALLQPPARRARLRALLRPPAPLFLVTVVLIPTLLAVLYYGLLAADIYVSESHFIVRSPSGVASGPDGAALVSDYLRSPEALQALQAQLALRSRFSAPHGDLASRFPAWGGRGGSGGDAPLLRYYRRHIVSLTHDAASGIITLRTSAFDARSARQINEQLLVLGEALPEQLYQRARLGQTRQAHLLVQQARQRLELASRALSEYRMRHGVFDPQRQSQLLSQQIDRLQQAWLDTQRTLTELQSVSPHSAQTGRLQTRMDVLDGQIRGISQRLNGPQPPSLAAQAREFAQLQTRCTLARAQLASALALEAQAENRALAQRLQLLRLVQPELPDAPQKPWRVGAILIVFTLSLVSWALLVWLATRLRRGAPH